MEGVDEPQHRTKVKPRKAGLTWVSVPENATPDIQSWQDGTEDGSGGTSFILTPGELLGSAKAVGIAETRRRRPRRSRITPYERRSRVTPVEQRG